MKTKEATKPKKPLVKVRDLKPAKNPSGGGLEPPGRIATNHNETMVRANERAEMVDHQRPERSQP